MPYDPEELESIFHRAREIETPEQRAAYLDESCAGRRELRQRVEQLLTAEDQMSDFMEGGAAAAIDVTVDQPAEEPGGTIGRYKLLEEIGEGGFGLVFVAQQETPIRRRVALKLIKPGMDTRQVIARFEAERQALAMMDHPHIAHVFDAGTTDSGRPYFVMELVRGLPITTYCDQAQLSPRDRLKLFADLGRAVQHAHQKGIIHRDLKPSNVLVTLHDGQPTVKIIDFGVAKALDRQLSEHSLYTSFHQMIGTPLYMSPEQTGMSNQDVDTRSDIYSLGVMLYELLTGSTPFDREQLAKGALEEVQRIIREVEPPTPSAKLSGLGDRLASIAAVRRTDPAKLTRLVRGDLDWIVMKCLEKDRNRRYDTALGLVDDLERYLSDEPVTASPPSVWYRWSKFAQKYRRPLLAIAALIMVLVAGTTVATWQALRATRSEQLAEQSAERTERVLDFLISAFRKPDPALDGRDVKVVDVLEQAMEDAKQTLAEDPLEQAAVLEAIAETLRALGVFDQAMEASQRALDIRTAELGDEHPDSLESLSMVAALASDLGQSDLALRHAEKLVEKSRRVLGPRHQDTLASMDTLAAVYCEVDRVDDALPLAMETLKLRRQTLGENHPETLNSMNTLAEVYRTAGRLSDALPLLEKAFQVNNESDDSDPHTMTSMNNLAHVYKQLGQIQRALSLYQDVLQRTTDSLGEAHPDTLAVMNNLAECYRFDGQFDKAIPLLEETLEHTRAALGEKHPHAMLTMNNLAAAYLGKHEHKKAADLLESSLQLAREQFGPDHPNSLIMQINLAACYEALGEIERSRELLETTLATCRLNLDENHPLTVAVIGNLGNLYRSIGDFEKALPLLQQTLTTERTELGADHPNTLITMTNLAAALESTGAISQAQGQFQEAYDRTLAKYGAEDPRTLARRLDLARVLVEAGKDQAALVAYRETHESLQRTAPENRRAISDAVYGMAAICLRAERRQQATELLADLVAAERERQAAGTAAGNAYDIALTLQAAGQVVLQGKACIEAEPYLRECLEIMEQRDNNDWRFSQVQSLLGEALLGQERFDEAEPFLLEGFEGMQALSDATVRPLPKDLKAAVDRLIRLYTETARPDEVARWRAKRAPIVAEMERLRKLVATDQAP